jgi:CelD/BcsL family acetyltransferase involved in cellulose biosynthesis
VTCTLVDRLDGLEAHGAAWDALAASLPQCLPMLTHAWVATYLERMEVPQGNWLAILAYDGEALVGVLVGVVEGGVLRVPCDYHADDGDVVLAVGREREALSALLAALRAHRPRIRALELGAVREDSPTNVALATGLPGWAQAREPALYGSSFEIHGDPGAWFQSLSKHLRADLRRYLNKLRKAGFDEPTLSFDAGSAAGPERLEDLMRLEASGWKGEAGSAIGMNEGTQTKYRSLARRFAAHGMLEWHELRLGDRLAAMHMCVRMGDDLMLLRHSFEDELGAFGVGNLLLRAAVEREHTRRAHGQINLVTDYAWCRRWRTKLSRYDHVVLARRRSLPFLTRVLPVRIRQLARRTPGAARLARWARSRREAGAGAPASR